MKSFLTSLRFVWRHPLNRKGRLAAIGRILRWQIGSRLLPGFVALPYVEKTRLFATRGMTGATGNWYCGLHEPNEMGFILHVLRPTDRFLDVGANIGSYTVIAAGAVGAETISVEPIPITFDHLRRNVILNGLEGKVSCYQIGISDSTGTLRFTDQFDTVNHVIKDGDDGDGNGVDIPVTTVDDLSRGRYFDIIKIDVEGHELSVLKGMVAALKYDGLLAVIMETNGSGRRYGVEDDQLVGIMDDNDFKPYSYDAIAKTLSHGLGAGNTIFIRDIDAVFRRVKTSRSYNLINGGI